MRTAGERLARGSIGAMLELVRTMCLVSFALCVLGLIDAAFRKNAWFRQLSLTGRLFYFAGLLFFAGNGIRAQVVIEEQREQVWVPNARSWPRLPLVVRLTSGLRSFLPQLAHAVDMWNVALGCRAFTVAASEEEPADVRVIFIKEAPCHGAVAATEDRVAAATYYCGDGTADIEVNQLQDIRVAYRLFAHELGHVLGLAHDPTGLMAESITSESLDEPVAPNHKDRQALAARYCPQERGR